MARRRVKRELRQREVLPAPLGEVDDLSELTVPSVELDAAGDRDRARAAVI